MKKRLCLILVTLLVSKILASGGGTFSQPAASGGGGGGGISSINGDSTAAQTLSSGTSGTDFAISDNGSGTHTFNLPTSSASNRGALNATDWTTFNAKAPTASPTFTGVAGFANGSGALPSIAQSADPDNGLSFGTNTVGISTSGTEQWRIDSSGDLVPVADNADDIGTSAARVKDVWASGSIILSTTGNQKLTTLSDATRIFTGSENGAQIQVRTTDTAVGGAGAFQVWDQRGYNAVFTDQYFSPDGTHDLGQTEAFGGNTFVRPKNIYAFEGFRGGDNAVANSTAANNVTVSAGNKTAGTGNGGTLTLAGGTSAGGSPGPISLNISGGKVFGFGTDGSIQATQSVADAGPPATTVAKMPIYDGDGVLIGYIAIYSDF